MIDGHQHFTSCPQKLGLVEVSSSRACAHTCSDGGRRGERRTATSEAAALQGRLEAHHHTQVSHKERELQAHLLRSRPMLLWSSKGESRGGG